MKNTEPTIEQARTILSKTLENKICFPSSVLRVMEIFSALEFDPGDAQAALASIPGHGQMAAELGLLHLLC